MNRIEKEGLKTTQESPFRMVNKLNLPFTREQPFVYNQTTIPFSPSFFKIEQVF